MFFYFFLWGYVKDQVYVPPLPASIPELMVRSRTANETTADMLQTVWNELINNNNNNNNNNNKKMQLGCHSVGWVVTRWVGLLPGGLGCHPC